jgi:bacteriophage exclusion system BrxA-like protein
MDSSFPYNGSLTAEQFLFHEIRILAKMYLEGKTIEEMIEIVKAENLFQYPTERQISRMTRACYKRLVALNNETLVKELVNAPVSIAKQINLYAMMRYNRVVWEFMILVIGEKYENQDFSFSKKDLNVFFTRLQEQDDDVASWSDKTVTKIKQVLTKILVEAEFLDSNKSTTLNHVYLQEELEQGIKANNDFIVLKAFNYFN